MGLTVPQTLMSGRVLALSLCYFGVQFGLYGVIFWIPQIFTNLGIAHDRVGYAIAIPYAIAAVGMVWWCRHSDRRKERVRHIAAAALVGFLGLSVSAFLHGSPILSVIAVTMGAAGAIALINALGNIGGFGGPFAIGWIKDATGSFTWGLVFVGSGVLSTGIIALLIGHDSAAEHGRYTGSDDV
jgi:MFS transporter, ACS family, tartrate transporter